MIRLLKHNEINKRRWDDCINKSFNGNVYALSWYLDIVHPNWNALIENDYERVMPLTNSKKFGLSYMFQPFFVQQLGVFSTSQLSQDDVDNFINAIPQQYLLTQYRLNSYNKVDYDSDIIVKHRNVELDLIYDYQYLYNNYNNNTKRNLAKAETAGLSINNNINPEIIISLFRNNRGKDVKHWKDKEYNRLLELINTAISQECCFTIGINDLDNNTIAGAVFMHSHDRIIFLFSGSDEAHKDKHALTMLLDNVIREFSETQYTLDFEGSDNDGLARFYKGFGGAEVFYPEVKYNNLKGILKFIYKLMRK
ncbi:MAG: peptidoglycan bridge formation glycyltransferase FemA/FemB family protein [Bacteroidales bacterium]|nr:peptidoglycan bridge formation glycyltransferase FemA/FemB family protein [Bacteroidales bacterium]